MFIWNTDDWTEVFVLEDEYLANDIIKYNRDGKLIAISDFDNVKIYDTEIWEQIYSIPSNDLSPLLCFDWSNIDNRCAFASDNKSINIWKFNNMSNSFELEKTLEFKFD